MSHKKITLQTTNLPLFQTKRSLNNVIRKISLYNKAKDTALKLNE